MRGDLDTATAAAANAIGDRWEAEGLSSESSADYDAEVAVAAALAALQAEGWAIVKLRPVDWVEALNGPVPDKWATWAVTDRLDTTETE